MLTTASQPIGSHLFKVSKWNGPKRPWHLRAGAGRELGNTLQDEGIVACRNCLQGQNPKDLLDALASLGFFGTLPRPKLYQGKGLGLNQRRLDTCFTEQCSSLTLIAPVAVDSVLSLMFSGSARFLQRWQRVQTIVSRICSQMSEGKLSATTCLKPCPEGPVLAP